MIYNIYKNNGKDVQCYIEISKRKLTIVDSGKQFNPLNLLNQYDISSTNQIGAQYLTIVRDEFSDVDMTYCYEDELNNFTIDFQKNAFLIDELCKINVSSNSFLKIKLNYQRNLLQNILLLFARKYVCN